MLASPVSSSIRQQLEITNGNFTFLISTDGKYVKIARSGETARAGFFLIPIEMWSEVVNFVYIEGRRRENDDPKK